MTRDDAIAMLRKRQGNESLRAFAGAVGVSAAYLSDVYRGRRDVGPKLLEYLGLKRERAATVTYSKAAR